MSRHVCTDACRTRPEHVAPREPDAQAVTDFAVFLAGAEDADLAAVRAVAMDSMDERAVVAWVRAWNEKREARIAVHS